MRRLDRRYGSGEGSAALARLDKGVIRDVDSIAGAGQVDPGFAGHGAGEGDGAGFRARPREGTGRAGQRAELDRSEGGLRQNADSRAQQCDQTEEDSFGAARYAMRRLWVAGRLHVCRITAAEGGRKKTDRHQRHLEKRLRGATWRARGHRSRGGRTSEEVVTRSNSLRGSCDGGAAGNCECDHKSIRTRLLSTGPVLGEELIPISALSRRPR